MPDGGWTFGVPVPACQPGVGGMVGRASNFVDDSHYYLACSQGARLIRVDRSTDAVTLITTMYPLSSTKNALQVHDTLGADSVADVLYLNHGTEDAFYFCDPGGAPFTDLLADYGPSASYGLGFDAAAGALWAFDDDTRELIEIE